MGAKGIALERIVTNYREVAADLGRSPTIKKFTEHKLAKFSYEQVREFFTDYSLMRAAGSTPPKKREYHDPKEDPKILVVDLEMLPMVLIGYGLYDQNFGPGQILHDATLASFACGFVGSDEVEYFEVNWRKDPRDDKALAKKLHAKLSEADIILGQNSDSFDVRVSNERFLTHDLGPSKPVDLLDTKKMGKKFWLPSYGLEYMSGRFCKTKKMVDRKFHGIALQRACMEKSPEAWAEMREYNIRDVLSTRELAIKLAPWHNKDLIHHKPGAIFRCTNVLCGSTNIIQRGWKPLRSGTFKQYSCNECGKWFHEKGSANNHMSPQKKASLKGPQ